MAGIMDSCGDWFSVEADPLQALGLFASSSLQVPLKHRAVDATVECGLGYADCHETLSYLSDAEAISATFKFPLPPKAAVYKFEATIGDRRVVTRVKAKAEAQEEFTNAVQQGHAAVLMKQADVGAIFTIELGNLPAMTECIIRISYLRILASVAGALEFVHTATYVPPYVSGADVWRDPTGQQLKDTTPTFAAKVTYSLSYSVRIVPDARGIRSVECMAPGATVSEEGGDHLVVLSEDVGDASRDFTLLVELKPDSGATSRLSVQRCQRDGAEKTVLLATFVNTLPAPEASPAVKREVWLVVDGSGSMGGSPIAQAREAALFFVKDLPANAGVRFNLVVFGSSHAMLYKGEAKLYDADSEKQAVAWVAQNVNSDWGGTEILSTLKAVYKVPITPGYVREVVFLTDGGVSGGEEAGILTLLKTGADPSVPPRGGGGGGAVRAVSKLISQRISSLFGGGAGGAKPPAAPPTAATPPPPSETAAEEEVPPTPPAPAATTSVFVLGIGHGVHRTFLDNMAETSGGVSQYVVDGEPIGSKCGYLRRCALADGAVLHPRLVSRLAVLRASPFVLPQRMFPGEPLHILAEVSAMEAGATLELQGELADGTPYTSAPLTLDDAAPVAGQALAVLHAMSYIGTLLSGTSPLHVKADGKPLDTSPAPDVVKAAVVRLAVAENLVTPHTSAVGVQLQVNPVDAATVQHVEVPLQMPHGCTLFGTGGGDQDLDGCHGRGPPGRRPLLVGGRGGGGPCVGGGGMTLTCSQQINPSGSLSMMQQQQQPLAMLSSAPSRKSSARSCNSAAPAPCCAAPAPQRPAGAPRQMQKESCSSSAVAAAPGANTWQAQESSAARDEEEDCEEEAAAKQLQRRSSVSAESDDAAGAGGVYLEGARFAQAEDGSWVMDDAAGLACPASDIQAELCKRDGTMKKAAAAGPADKQEKKDKKSGKQRLSLSAELCDEAAAPPAGQGMGLAEALAWLNLLRQTDGSFPYSDAALGKLAGAAAAGGGAGGPTAAALSAAAPEALSRDQWMTVLVLAFLRRHLNDKRSVWEAMEAKALAWLAAAWPAAARSVGATTLMACKLV